MTSQALFAALNEVASEDILSAGQAGGFLPGKQKKRTALRIVLIAAALILLAGAAGAKMVLGIWNDRWLQQPAPDPAAVVRGAIENQTEKEYTVSVEVGTIREDTREGDLVWTGSRDSMFALQNGWTDTKTALEERCGGSQSNFKAFYANYTVEYDHTKTFYRDGTLGQWFYLTRDADGNWEIWESGDPILLNPQEAAEEPGEAPAEHLLTDPDGAVQEAVEMVKAWESFDDVRAITVDSAQCSEAYRQRALALVPGSALAEAEGWTETYLWENLAAVEITWTTQYNPYPDLPDPPDTTETEVYYLLRDPVTGVWHNSEISGFMDGQE